MFDSMDETVDDVWQALRFHDDEEIRVGATVSVRLTWRQARIAAPWMYLGYKRLPGGPALYVIATGDRPWYIGIAGIGRYSSLRTRFATRFTACRELALTPRMLGPGCWPDRRLYFATAVARKQSTSGSITRTRSGRRRPVTTLSDTLGALRAIENLLIRRLRTRRRGNRAVEPVTFIVPHALLVQNANPGDMPPAVARILGGAGPTRIA
jgi:hypothetical protein